MVRSEIISKLSKRIHHKLKKRSRKDFSNRIRYYYSGNKNNKSTELRDFGRFSVKELKKKLQ